MSLPLQKSLEFHLSEDHDFKRINTVYRLLLLHLRDHYLKYSHLSSREIQRLSFQAVLHDAGKMKIPPEFLNAPRKLTDSEFELMRQHPVFGIEVLQEYGFFHENKQDAQNLYDICRYHHERWDGRGYPDGLTENEIPMTAQLMAIVDVYDALRRERTYKHALTHEQAMETIKLDFGHFSPTALACFHGKEKLIGILYPSVTSAYGSGNGFPA